MKTEVITTANFRREAKPLLKKYPSLRAELARLETELLANPTLGSPLGNHTYKVRVAIRSKGKGKSGGARVITFLELEAVVEQATVYLLTIYDKSETDSITAKEIERLLKKRFD
jgi:hypothetical protein